MPLIYTLAGSPGLALLSVLFKKTGLPLVPAAITSGLSMLGLLAGSRFYLSRWMKKKRKTYVKLFDRFWEMLANDAKKESTLSIETSDNNQNNTDQHSISGERQESRSH